jgi:acyl carrier protein
MNTNDEIRSKLRTFLEETCLVSFDDDVQDDTNLIDAGFIDSFGIVQLVAFIEQTFGVRLTDAEMTSRDLAVLNGVVRLVSAKLST